MCYNIIESAFCSVYVQKNLYCKYDWKELLSNIGANHKLKEDGMSKRKPLAMGEKELFHRALVEFAALNETRDVMIPGARTVKFELDRTKPLPTFKMSGIDPDRIRRDLPSFIWSNSDVLIYRDNPGLGLLVEFE